MKYRVFNTKQEAIEAQNQIYRDFISNRANDNNGYLDDWKETPIKPILIENINDEELTGDRFPLYGQRASDLLWITEFGHTTAWALPEQIQDGRWVFASPDDEGIEAQEDWFATNIDNLQI